MTQDDVLFGYRLQVFDLAGRTSVSEACRTFGIHRSTYYAWKRQVERGGLEMLRPRERRRPQMPNQLPAMVEERVLSFSIAHPGLGPKKVAAELARPKWGGIVVSPNGVYKTLLRHGLNTAEQRLSLVAGYRAPYRQTKTRAQSATSRSSVRASWSGWTASTSAACAQPAARSGSSARSTSARRSAGPSSSSARATTPPPSRPRNSPDASPSSCARRAGSSSALARLGAHKTHIHAGRPQTNGHVEALHKTILKECWRPAFARYLYPRYTGLRRELDTYPNHYNFDRVHHGRLTRGRTPADIVYGARKMEAR